MRAHPGKCTVGIRLRLPELAEVELAMPDDIRVEAAETMVDQIEALLGRGVVRYA